MLMKKLPGFAAPNSCCRQARRELIALKKPANYTEANLKQHVEMAFFRTAVPGHSSTGI